MIAKRALDVLGSLAALVVLSPLLLLIYILVRLSSEGPALHWSKRIGRNNAIFQMPKFRTMRIDAPQVPTHLLADPEQWVTPVGKLLRATSLDELPQLWTVLRGKMSLVGPRPALFNQNDLIDLRTRAGVHLLIPGVTGLAQVSGRDELPIRVKVEYDAIYARRQSFFFDLSILVRTVVTAVSGRGISH